MLNQKLQLKLSQKLSPQQIQLMKLIQMTTAELEQKVKNEIDILALEKFDNVKFSTAFSSFGSSLERPSSICFNISSSFLFKPISRF